MSMTETKAVAKPALVGGGMIRAIVPQDFESAYRMAQVISAAKMAPKSLDTVEKVCVAIMHGLEVGLTPMAAVQSIAVINGSPSLWGDGMLALIEGSGLLEDMEETHEIDDKGEWQWSRCIMKRVGRKTPADNMFTRAQAMKAGLLNKPGPWTQYPDRMGKWRARGYSGRDLFSDVLKGLRQTEEMMDMVDITPMATATTAPAEPRRSDFQPPPADQGGQQQDAEDEGWPLHDQFGETVGRLGSGEWANKFLDAAGKLEGKEREALLENNRETAKAIWEDDGTAEDTAKALSAAYEPLTEAETVKNWKVEAVGEPAKIKVIKDLIAESAGTTVEVDDILKQNGDFIAKLSAFKRDDINKAAAARKMKLSSLPT